MTASTSLRGVTWRRYTSAVTSILSFVSSSVHFDWCTVREDFQVRRMEHILSRARDRPSPSHCIDVGMNDGFYTMLMAASGCIVNSFEVQPLCVDIAHMSLKQNDFGENVTIHTRPVSHRHEEKLTIPMDGKRVRRRVQYQRKNLSKKGTLGRGAGSQCIVLRNRSRFTDNAQRA